MSGIKNIILTKRELEFVALYHILRRKMSRFDDKFMFPPLDITNAQNADPDLIYGKNKQYYKTVKNLFKTGVSQGETLENSATQNLPMITP